VGTKQRRQAVKADWLTRQSQGWQADKVVSLACFVVLTWMPSLYYTHFTKLPQPLSQVKSSTFLSASALIKTSPFLIPFVLIELFNQPLLLCINTLACLKINQYSTWLFVSYSRKNPTAQNTYWAIHFPQISMVWKDKGPLEKNKMAKVNRNFRHNSH